MTVSSATYPTDTPMTDTDVVVVGGSIAGAITATLLARHGARVTVVERSASLDHHKKLCTHEIAAIAVPVFERLGIMNTVRGLSGRQGATNIWTRYGWIRPELDDSDAGLEGFNIRRSVLDPIVRTLAVDTQGVTYRSGTRVIAVHQDETGRPMGVRVSCKGVEEDIRARVVVGADGSSSSVAAMTGTTSKTIPHRRFAYAAYFEGVPPALNSGGIPHSRIWMMQPDMAYAFPTDAGLTLLCCAPLRDEARMAAFKADIDGEFLSMMSSLPDAPDLSAARRVGGWQGTSKSQNIKRLPSSPGLAFVGDAALVTDFVWGTGCGFASASAAWLADSIGPVLAGGGSNRSVDAALRSYRRTHRRALILHYLQCASFSSGRPFHVGERLLFRGAAHDDRVARAVSVIGSRTVSPLRALTPAVLARAVVAPVRDRSIDVEPVDVRG